MGARIRALGLVFVAIGASMVPSSAATTYDRLYLGASENNHLSWSVDPNDPETPYDEIAWTCGYAPNAGTYHGNCLSGISVSPPGHLHSLFFEPLTWLDEPVSWDASSPLRYRFELSVTTPAAYTVALVWQIGTNVIESAPATETAPGTFEGTMKVPGTLDQNVAYNIAAIRIRTAGSHALLRLGLRGRSYIELPRAVSARSVPALLADTPAPTAPAEFASAFRRFEFNDDAWSAHSFQGTLDGLRTFTAGMSGRATTIVAWVEAFGAPFVADTVDERRVDTTRLTDAPIVKLYRDGKEIDHGANVSGTMGRGIEAVATNAVDAGALTLEVAPSARSQGAPYSAHIVIVYGERTLSKMSWRAALPYQEPSSPHRTPISGVCPGSYEPVPQPPEVTTFRIDLRHRTVSPIPQKWTLRYSIPTVGSFPCGEAGNGDWLRFVFPGERVWFVGPTPARDATFVSVRDAVFDMSVSYAYAPTT